MANNISFWLSLSLHTALEHHAWIIPAMLTVGAVLVAVWTGILLRNVLVSHDAWSVLSRRMREWALPGAFIVAGIVLVLSGGDWLGVALDSMDWAVRRWLFDLHELLSLDIVAPFPPSMMEHRTALLRCLGQQ